MPSGVVAEWKRCHAVARRTGARCKRAKSPGTDYCYKHNGWHPRVLKKAEERVNRARNGMDPELSPGESADLVRRFDESTVRRARAQMRKTGTLEDYDEAARRLAEEDARRQAELVAQLGPEEVERQRQMIKARIEWETSGRVGPRPPMPGEEHDTEARPPVAEKATPETPATVPAGDPEDGDDGDSDIWADSEDEPEPETSEPKIKIAPGTEDANPALPRDAEGYPLVGGHRYLPPYDTSWRDKPADEPTSTTNDPEPSPSLLQHGYKPWRPKSTRQYLRAARGHSDRLADPVYPDGNDIDWAEVMGFGDDF